MRENDEVSFYKGMKHELLRLLEDNYKTTITS